MITKDKPYSRKGKINLLLLPLVLLISIFLFSAPPLEAINGQLEELQAEIERLPSEMRIATSAEAMHTFRERVSKLRARIEETAAVGLISPEDRSVLRGRLGATVWEDSNAEFYIPIDRSMPSLEGRYEAIPAAARDISLKYDGQRKLEGLRPLVERFNLLKEDLERAYYQGLISEGQRNALRQRIEQEQRRLEEEIANLETQPRPEGPVTPTPPPREEPPRSGPEQVTPPTPGRGMQKQQAGRRPPGEQESDESLQQERSLMAALNAEMERLELEWMRRRAEGERTVDPIVMMTETSGQLREALIRLRAWERPSGE